MDTKDILKKDYLDIVFEGRNKSYGGYELRKKYPKRARLATAIAVGAVLLIVAWPVIAGIIKSKMPVEPPPVMKEVTLAEPPPIDPNEPPPPPPPAEPPPPVKPTVKFTPPVIKKDEEVKEDERPPDVTKDLKETAAGPTTAVGDPNGIDPGIIDNPGTGSGPVDAPPPPPKIFTFVEQMPSFPGGNDKLPAWLQNNLRYPDQAREAGQEGKVFVKFVVSEDGSISDVTIQRGFGYGSEEEAKRVVKSMPKWTPGKQNGNPVKVYYNLPITFRLE